MQNCLSTHMAVACLTILSVNGPFENLSAHVPTEEDFVSLSEIPGLDKSARGERAISISPNGEFVAFQVRKANPNRNTYQTDWYAAPINQPNSNVIHLGDGGEPIDRLLRNGQPNGVFEVKPPEWRGDSRSIVHRKQINGRIQLFQSFSDGVPQRQLTDNVHNVTSFVLSEDGELVLFEVDEARTEFNARRALEARRGFLFNSRFTPYISAKPLRDIEPQTPSDLFTEKLSNNIFVIQLNSGQQRLATEEEAERYRKRLGLHEPNLDRVALATLSSSSGKSAWAEAMDPKKQGLVIPRTIRFGRDVHDSGAKTCHYKECTGIISRIWWDASGSTIFFERWAGANNGFPRLYGWELGQDVVFPVIHPENEDEYISGCDIKNDVAVCLSETPSKPVRLISFSLGDGKTRTLFDPNPNFSTFRLGDVQRLEWKDDFGNWAFGHLVTPANYDPSIRYPLVIVQYRSRGFLRGGVGDEYPIHLLANAGFIVLSFDQPRDWSLITTVADPVEFTRMEWDNFYSKRRSLSALENKILELERAGIIDPERIGITGLSSGSDNVNFGLIHSDRFSTAITSGGTWSPLGYYLMSPVAQEFNRIRGFGDPDTEDGHNWAGISMAMNANRIDVPILLNASDSEFLLDVQAATKMRAAGNPLELHVFPNEFHIKKQPIHRLNIYRRNIQWFKFWLQAEEVDNPVDLHQYARWQKMRNDLCENLKTKKKNSRVYCE